MNGDTNWTALLRCGHDAPLQGKPEPGGWITCTDHHCQHQERVVAVSPVLHGAPGPGETGIQETLWEIAS